MFWKKSNDYDKILGVLICCFTFTVNSQEYNKWSLDLESGVTEIINPLLFGYKTGSLSLGKTSLWVRYMFKQKFGLRLDLGYNKFNEGKNNLPFKSNYYRTTLEGVLNARNLLKFSSWTNRFNLLFHRGSNVGFIRELLNSEYINVLFNTT